MKNGASMDFVFGKIRVEWSHLASIGQAGLNGTAVRSRAALVFSIDLELVRKIDPILGRQTSVLATLGSAKLAIHTLAETNMGM